VPVPGVGAPAREAAVPVVPPPRSASGGSGVRRGLAAGGVVVAAVSAGVVGWSSWPRPGTAAQPALSAQPAARSVPAAVVAGRRPAAVAGGPDFRVVVERLAQARAAALTGAEGGLASVDEPGSPAWAADAGLLKALARHRLRLERLRFEVGAVRVVARSRERGREVVTVRCTVAVPAHLRVPTARGSIVAGQQERVPAQSARQVRLVLVGSAERWLVRAVT